MAEQPSLELIYFDGAGRAEPTRIALHISGLKWTDTREAYPELLARKKALGGWGGWPRLVVNGETINQSSAILRYAGKLSGLYPEDPILALKVDSWIDNAADLMVKAPQDPDKEKKLELRKAWLPELNLWLAGFDALIGDAQFAVGDKFTIADLAIRGVATAIQGGDYDGIPPETVDPYKNLLRVSENVSKVEGVVSWNAKRAAAAAAK